MFYNSWKLQQTSDTQFLLHLENWDDQDRMEQKEYLPLGVGGGAVIHFPRVDELTNQKYKKVLLDHVLSVTRDRITHLNSVVLALEELENH